MSDFLLFILGFIFTLIVVAAMALLIWGAVLDGRAEAARRGARPGDESGQ
jgi:hypothetical protein